MAQAGAYPNATACPLACAKLLRRSAAGKVAIDPKRSLAALNSAKVRYGICRSTSVRLDICRSYYIAPFLYFRADKLAEVGG